jgi:hypothetical protein
MYSNNVGHIVVPKVLSVSECIKLPLPDVKWMKPPVLSRNQFVGWIGLEDNVIE